MSGAGTGKEPSHVAIARSIGVAIVLGALTPGTFLATELELAAQRGVARNVVREALRILAAKGLIVSRRRAGTRVRERHHWNLLDPDVLAWMFEGRPSLAFVRALFELRMIIEPAAAALAASRRGEAQLSRMADALAGMEKHGLADPVGQIADQQFHAELLAATGNELLTSLSGSIAAAVHWTTFFKYQASPRPPDPIPQHRALLQAIADGDPAAARSAAADLIDRARVDTEETLGR